MIRLKQRTKNSITGYAFTAPVVIGVLLFTLTPVLLSLYFGFTKYDNINPPQWIGLDNYRKMFSDPTFLNSLKITCKYAVVSVTLNMVLSFGFALLMNSDVRGISVYRVLLYLPCVVPGLASAMIWKDLFNPTSAGRINQIITALGFEPYPFLYHPDTAWNSMIIMSLWGLAGGMLMWLAGFKSVPTALYEVAAIEGAKWYHRLWYVTIPMVSPIIFYKLVNSVIGALQAFGNAYLTTGGGPLHSTNFLVLNIYNTGLTEMNMGYACAQSGILFAIIFALTAVIFKTNSWVFYGEEQ